MEQPAKVEFENNDLVRTLCGGHNENLRLIERRLGVTVGQRGSNLLVAGEPTAVGFADRLLRGLYELLSAGYRLYPEDVEQAIKVLSGDGSAKLEEIFLDTVFVSSRKRTITPKGFAQKRYVEAIRSHDIVFGIGPAGTGKTYLAVAMAVSALAKEQVARIILTRPAVEAGEKLGFLPGDMAQKVDPYLRPLTDALNDMMGQERAAELTERAVIEVAPLAFMRGRTLNNAFIILDEAQNTTREQMKMFLTRIGFDSCAVITGDVTQIDLPGTQKSGLIQAERILTGIKGIAFRHFSKADVVRHPLVQEIIHAYEQQGSGRRAPANTGREG